MSIPNSRASLTLWAKRKLGFPVIQINVSEEQIEDRLDEALQLFRDYHEDATERIFLKHQITAENITNEYISIDDNIISVSRVLPLAQSSAYSSSTLFNVPYQLKLDEVFNLGGQSLVGYTLTMANLALMDRMFSQEPLIEFNRHQNRLYLYTNWSELVVGQYMILECFRILDGDTYTDIWNDRWLKAYFTQLVKKQWGENLSKYGDVKLPGGTVLNGDRILQEAKEELTKLEEDLDLKYQEPMMPEIG